jgi:hypothetical protein
LKTAIALTTIHIPHCLADYAENLNRYDHKNVTFIVVSDLKTPPEAKACCERMSADFDRPVVYLDVDEQRRYLARFPALDAALPYNSFARRNVGDLWAYEHGAEVLVRVDDDNYPTDGDFLAPHLACGREVEATSVRSSLGWFNVCELLVERQGIPFYPRGFPYSQRWKPSTIDRQPARGRVAVNAGLWLGDPDVDALTRLTFPIDATAMQPVGDQGLLLEPGTWCPINTQNTAFHRDALSAAYIPANVGRYDDIWMGYILRRIIDHMGDRVSYGWPLVSQRRNVHNLWRDLDAEMNGNLYTDRLVDALRSMSLSSSTYADCYGEVLEGLSTSLGEQRPLFEPILEGGRAWHAAVTSLDRRCAY